MGRDPGIENIQGLNLCDSIKNNKRKFKKSKIIKQPKKNLFRKL